MLEGQAVRHGQITLGREESAKLLYLGIRFFLAAALTAARTPGGYAPFALGTVAAAGAGSAGVAALLGTVAGAVAFLDFGDALPFLASGLLILTAAAAFRESRLFTGKRAMPLTAAAVTMAVGGIYVVQALAPLDRLTPCLAAAGLAGAATRYLQPLLRGEREGASEGLLFLGGAMLIALQEPAVMGISPGRVLLCLMQLYTAYDRGRSAGTASGLGLGLMTDLCTGSGSAIFTAGLGLGGFAAGSRAGGRRTGAALAFLAAELAVLLPSREALARPFLAECALGAGLFLLLPGKAFGGKRVRRGDGETAVPVGNLLRERLDKVAVALRDLHDCMGRTVPASGEENPAVIFDRTAEKVCRDCALCSLCWQKEYTGTFNALNDATPTLLERGRAMAKDFPGYFSSRCIHLPDFIMEVNNELSSFLLRKQYRRQLEETRRSAQGQYAQLSELLTAAAAGLRPEGKFLPGEETACRVGAALHPKEGETVCGDTLMSFGGENGLRYLLLADGMGSGEAARRESAMTCRLLRQFLEAGIEAEAALKTLNAAMALRGAETGSFTTVDLCACGPNGDAVFYKYGAAPSYLKKGGTVRRITGNSWPVGLRGTPAMPDVTRVTLERGSFAVMISDGVADPGRDEWLMDLLAGWQGEDPQALASLVLTESARREKLQDDCAVQVLFLDPDGAKPV